MPKNNSSENDTQVMKTSRTIKPLSELNLLDRFLFDEVMEDAQTAKDILEIILEREIPLLDQTETEKEFRRSPQLRGIRIDVFSMDAEKVVYNTEMQQRNTGNLPKRSRYYQGHIDVSLLEPGIVDFNRLNDAYIIIIAPFDLWGLGRYRYTFRMKCEEEPSLHLEDGACRIFLNTRGTCPDGISQELIDFLHYVENSSAIEGKIEGSEKLQRIHNRVRKVKENEEVGVKYMQKWEELAYAKEDGRAEGLTEGHSKGLAEGKAESILSFLAEYGEIPAILKEEILTQTDPETLERWLKLAARAGSIAAFVSSYREQPEKLQ